MNDDANPTGCTLAELAPPGPWTTKAACRLEPRHLFFPERGEDLRPAKQICARCPVHDDCRAYSLAAPAALTGVWGGLGKTARDRMRRHQADPALQEAT